MKDAREFFEELAAVLKPLGYQIRLSEVEPKPSHDFNWLATGVDANQHADAQYQRAIAELRKRHPRLNWEGVVREGKCRSITR